MSQMKYPSRIRYEYIQEPGCRLQYTHGVWGGINPQGEIEVNFYVESDKMPAFSERTVEPDGTLGVETAPFDEEERVVTRCIHTRMLFNYHTARAFIEWLEEKTNALEMDQDELYPAGDSGSGVPQ